MNHKYIIYSIGKLLQIFGAILIAPCLIALFETNGNIIAKILSPNSIGFIISILISLILGTTMVLIYRKDRGEINVREGFAIVTFSWVAAWVIGAIPLFIYFISQNILSQNILQNENVITAQISAQILQSWTDAMFETMSGLSTMGGTVIADVESLPRGILFWRQMTQWVGGMGFVTLALAMFPAFGVAAYQMFRGEMTGPTKERLRPRLAQTSMILWGVYVFFTFVLTLLLMLGDMSLYDAVCHAFTTLATGGFSTRNASVSAFDSAYIEWVIIAFMAFGGTSFFIHYRIIFHNDYKILKTHSEFHFYIGVLLVAAALIVGSFYLQGLQTPEWVVQDYNSINDMQDAAAKIRVEERRVASAHDAIRHSLFQVVSVTTTTGYGTADWNVWPNFARTILFLLLFFGGCAGATSGGIKMIRIFVLFKAVIHHARTMVDKRRIFPLKVGGKVLNSAQVTSILQFFILYLLLFAGFSLLMTIFVPDLATAISAVASAMGNVGPGLSGVGAFETYAWIPQPGKWILMLCMLLGRLEIYTVLIVLSPSLWRR